MKANYYLRKLMLLIAVCSVTGIAAQSVKQPVFTEVQNPVIGSAYAEPGKEGDNFPFGFVYESAVAWGDYNNDGYLDLIKAGWGHGKRITALYKNNGDGTFTYLTETPFPSLNSANTIWLDYNNDGNLDLFLAGHNGASRYSGLWKNLGETGNYEFEEVCIGDFEYIHNEGGNRNNRYIVAADYDNDGWVDLYFHGQDENGSRFTELYKNINGERFEVAQNAVVNPINADESFVKMNAGGAAWGDYNKDGYMDLISNGYWNGFKNPDFNPDLPENDVNWKQKDGGFMYIIYKNNGDGTFSVASYENKEGTQGDVVWCDYNNDGWLDYMVQGYGWFQSTESWTDKSDIYENNQDGTFTCYTKAPDNGLPIRGEGSVAFGDVNNDGFEDILFMRADPNAVFLNNNMDGTFTRVDFLYEGKDPDTEPVTLNGNRGGSTSLVDINNDGNLDAFFAGYVDGRGEVNSGRYQYSALFRNDLGEGIPVNEAPSAPTNLQKTVTDGIVTFTWNASTDDLTDPEAIRYNLYVKYGNTIMSVLPADLETGRLKVNETLAPLTTTFYKMSGLPASFEWGVQAIDNAKNASAFAKEGVTAIETPLAGKISIETEKGAIKVSANEAMEGSVEVFAVNGAKVYAAGTVNATAYLQAGVYIVKVTAQSGSLVKKVVLK